MDALLRLAGIVSIGAGILLCLPLAGFTWAVLRASGLNPNGFTQNGFAIGGMLFRGYQAWLVLGGAALLGLGLIGLGIYVAAGPSRD